MNLANLLTSLNLIAGTTAILLGDPFWGGLLVILGAIFDLLDGQVARMIGAESPLGKELDSLADLITFGMAPAYLYWITRPEDLAAWIVIVAISLLVASTAWRLAQFNTLPGAAIFRGLPSPASGLFFAGWVLAWQHGSDWFLDLHRHPVFYLSLPLVFATLMNIRAPFFSAKNFTRRWPEVLPFLLLVVIACGLFLFVPYEAAPLTIVAYIVLALAFFPMHRHR